MLVFISLDDRCVFLLPCNMLRLIVGGKIGRIEGLDVHPFGISSKFVS